MKKEKEATTVELAEAPKRRDMFAVRPENLIAVQGFNLREEEEGDYGDIEAFALELKNDGQKTPLRVYRSSEDSNKFNIVDGHRRLKAIIRANELGANIEFVDVFLEPRKYSEAERIMDMIRCNSGLPLTNLAKARGFLRLQNVCKMPVKEIVKISNMSQASVYKFMDLATAPEEVKALITEDKISSGTVMAIMKDHKKPEEQIALVKEAIEGAKEEGVKTGKAPKKATAKHIKSTVTVKTPMKILEEVGEKLQEDIQSDLEELFVKVLEAAKAKKSVSAIVKLFRK